MEQDLGQVYTKVQCDKLLLLELVVIIVAVGQ